MGLSFLVPRRRNAYLHAIQRNSMGSQNSNPIVQFARIQENWLDATRDVPYYKELVQNKSAPNVLKNWQDFFDLPILSKQVIQNNPGLFTRISRKPSSFITTAGSTGTPLKLGVDRKEQKLMEVVKISEWIKYNYNLRSRLFLIWGHPHLLGSGLKKHVNQVKRKLGDSIYGYKRVDAFHLDKDHARYYGDLLLGWKPIGVIGYASALDLFVRHNMWRAKDFGALGVRFVLSTTEMAPRPDTFDLIQQFFNCPVVQEYGGAEAGQIAFADEPNMFRVYSDLNFVELDPGSRGNDSQSILVTSLYPRYIPLFRYQIGDEIQGAVLGPEKQVSSFQRLVGRVNDVIKLESGASIHSVAVFHCIHHEPSVLNIQMVLRDDFIEIILVSTKRGDTEVEKRIMKKLTNLHPSLGNARICYADDLQTNRAGKRRWFIDLRSSKQ